MKTSELTGAALDWAVAKCIGFEGWVPERDWKLWRPEKYSTDWAHGGPIIEREQISVDALTTDWMASYLPSGETICGDTPLIAAMRCYCCAKLGDEIDIPEELCQQQSN